MKGLTTTIAAVALFLVVIVAVLVAVIQTITAEPLELACGIDTPELNTNTDTDDTDSGSGGLVVISDRLTLSPAQVANARLILGAAKADQATEETTAAMLMRSLGRAGLLNLADSNGLLALEPLAYPGVDVLDKGRAITAYLTTPPDLADTDEQWRAEATVIAARWSSSPENPATCISGTSSDPANPIDDEDIVTVRGIAIHRSIAPQLAALLRAAEAAGYPLSGWGWRSHQRQHELRKINGCSRNGRDDGSWTHTDGENPNNWVRSSTCRTPTARPGFSNHESGLAVDFTFQGRTIGSRRSPAFQWLAANAGRYGFRNLPSEPWHWSTDGR